ncbi:hypothetical protein [Streptomyces sp. NPDC001903]|uniref:hypothetical protein n=1 Tax=Streptomyces sp. NPDC001903 TaxID=3364622 RepID=UPI00368D09B0
MQTVERDATSAETPPASGVRAVPDVHLGEAHLAAARAVLDEAVGRDNVRLAFVSGSLAAGLGHGLSDIDLYVATTDDAPRPEVSYERQGFVVQLTPVSHAELDRIVRICRDYTDTATDRWQTGLSDVELQRAVRFAIGTVLVDNGSGVPEAAQARLTIRRVLMNRSAYQLNSYAEDALGALQVGDTLTALQTSLIAVELSLECVLSGVGDVYLGRKFHLRRAARSAALREVLTDVWEALRQPADLGCVQSARRIVVRRLLLVSHLVAHALLGGWDAPLDRVPRFADRRAEGGPVRSPWVTPVRFSDAWGMSGPDIGYRVTEAMVRVWAALDGRPREELLTAARDTFPEDVPRELLDAAVTRLVESGAAVPDGGPIRIEDKEGGVRS